MSCHVYIYTELKDPLSLTKQMPRIFLVVLILSCTRCNLWKMYKIIDNIQLMFGYHDARIGFQVFGRIQDLNCALNIRCDAHLINVMKCRWQILRHRYEQSRTVMQLCNTLHQTWIQFQPSSTRLCTYVSWQKLKPVFFLSRKFYAQRELLCRCHGGPPPESR